MLNSHAHGTGRGKRGLRILFEILLILLLSLVVSLVYNAVSPTGIRILPKKPGPDVTQEEIHGEGRLASPSAAGGDDSERVLFRLSWM